MGSEYVLANEIRARFAQAMSEMYRTEVPLYGELLELVSEVNAETVENHRIKPNCHGFIEAPERLNVERHGAIRVGTAAELSTIRRLFAVMGMDPVGYYDLSVAGIPVHSTAFRPISEDALRINPFRVFTSLLRLDLIEDRALREEASKILQQRKIFAPRALELIALAEDQGGLRSSQADEFIRESLKTFRWNGTSMVGRITHGRMLAAHRLIADVVCFPGPHINHLTPRTLDIDRVQERMPKRGITPKAVIEGPPPRNCPILLRQTSFKALNETVIFDDGAAGTHTARFGEIEQRGIALTPAGRRLYDELLRSARHDALGNTEATYQQELAFKFASFPDSWSELRQQKLAFFRYKATPTGCAAAKTETLSSDISTLIKQGFVAYEPIVYEDFLPVSAAGIFQSNLGSDEQKDFDGRSNRSEFEAQLGGPVLDEMDLYQRLERASIDRTRKALGLPSVS